MTRWSVLSAITVIANGVSVTGNVIKSYTTKDTDEVEISQKCGNPLNKSRNT